jgi:hypothetical protein
MSLDRYDGPMLDLKIKRSNEIRILYSEVSVAATRLFDLYSHVLNALVKVKSNERWWKPYDVEAHNLDSKIGSQSDYRQAICLCVCSSDASRHLITTKDVGCGRVWFEVSSDEVSS